MARKEKTIHYIYKTTCLVTNRYYIGMHSTSKLDDGYMGSGKRLRYSIRKYGIDNHIKEILEFFETRELLIEAEKIAITPNMITDRDCMNLMSGGTGGFISKEHQIKLSKAGIEAFIIRLENDIELQNKYRENGIRCMSLLQKNGKVKYGISFKGKRHSAESKIKISNAMKGNGRGDTNSQFGTCWITKDSENKKIKKEDLEIYQKDGWIKGRK